MENDESAFSQILERRDIPLRRVSPTAGSGTLNQDEIAQLLTAINPEPMFSNIENMEDLSQYLTNRKPPEDAYGLYTHDVTTLKFFDNKNSEKILADIEQKNEEQGMGNRKIPGTKIKLINYSYCPKCNTIYSMSDLMTYYANPKEDPQFKNIKEQCRQDTRVCCHECSTYFLPTLIISDGTPKNEIQHLCRVQTIHGIEVFYKTVFKKPVLSKSRRNIVQYKNTRNIWSDILLKELTPKPTLIGNLIQYSPANCIINLVEGTNIKNGDFLYGGWGGLDYKDYWK
ncbi:hypothetical protein TREPR_1881 [Treponema primitia ZAS-2]|uniref:Uncharacterized protein n=1 Tax=Treponema primitia (strain ATCC BAA-887 / DSM 12427 / ZAS-2) TaxID=545694 RepID=F5YL50_TREPZ|nr:hypothetical protein [Treponema primitia]AEF86298.1 hypothetical protein TREPR_1881 [Treponema primitia ZAS-2]